MRLANDFKLFIVELHPGDRIFRKARARSQAQTTAPLIAGSDDVVGINDLAIDYPKVGNVYARG